MYLASDRMVQMVTGEKTTLEGRWAGPGCTAWTAGSGTCSSR